jgi:chromosome segregation ATPase
MTTVTESDIKELKELINSQFASLHKEIIDLNKEIIDLKVSVARIEASLQSQQQLIQKIPDLAEKIGELKNWKQIVFIVVTASVGTLIGWLIRGGNS